MKIKKKHILRLGLAMILIGASVGGLILYRQHQERVRHQEEELRLEREAELEIIYTYFRLHYAFVMMPHPDTIEMDEEGYEIFAGSRSTLSIYEFHGVYRELPGSINDHGIKSWVYLLTIFYRNETGIYLSYELIIDYFSEEFEPDGSLRLYNNGNHPEIEAFVTWKWENRKRDEFREYLRRIERIQTTYNQGRREQGLESLGTFDHFSPQMLDALARAEADPDYELDLTSLQEAGY